MHCTAAIPTAGDRLESSLTEHARFRMKGRGVTPEAIAMTVAYGRLVHVRGAEVDANGLPHREHQDRDAVR